MYNDIETEYIILMILDDRHLCLTRYFLIRNNNGIRDHTTLACSTGFWDKSDSWNADVVQVDVTGNELIKVLYGE